MSSEVTFTAKVRFGRGKTGAVELVKGGPSVGDTPLPAGRVPKVARLMALAIRFQGLLERGELRNYAELARLGHVTRARLTQIMNLLNLAPDLQEQILFLPAVEHGRDPIKEWQVRPVAAELRWAEQRRAWAHATSG